MTATTSPPPPVRNLSLALLAGIALASLPALTAAPLPVEMHQ